MRKDEFLRMMVQDNETEPDKNKKALYADVIECMDIALSQSPADTGIADDKTAEGAYKTVEEFARKNNRKSVGPFESAELIAEYLGVKYERAIKKYANPPTVNLDDLLD